MTDPNKFYEEDLRESICEIPRRDFITEKRDNFGQILMVDMNAIRNLFIVADERIMTQEPLIPPNCFVYLFTNENTILHRAIQGRQSFFSLLQRQNIEIDVTPNIRDDAHIVGMTQEIGEYNEKLPQDLPFTILAPDTVYSEIVLRIGDFRDVKHIKTNPPTSLACKSMNDRSWIDPLKLRLWENAHLPILKYR